MDPNNKRHDDDPNSPWNAPIGINPDGTLNIVGIDASLYDPTNDETLNDEYMTEPDGLND
jgi:hypothetical protein